MNFFKLYTLFQVIYASKVGKYYLLYKVNILICQTRTDCNLYCFSICFLIISFTMFFVKLRTVELSGENSGRSKRFALRMLFLVLVKPKT